MGTRKQRRSGSSVFWRRCRIVCLSNAVLVVVLLTTSTTITIISTATSLAIPKTYLSHLRTSQRQSQRQDGDSTTTTTALKSNPKEENADEIMYDLIIVGAGASGLFASGAALSFGWKTLLLDQQQQVGGDCTNAACVPSKALRSMARRRNRSNRCGSSTVSSSTTQQQALDHRNNAVWAVRQREDSRNFENVTLLDLVFVERATFVSEDAMELMVVGVPPHQDVTTSIRSSISPMPARRIVRAKKFLLATGASPMVPVTLQREASHAGLPLFTYRDVLSPSTNDDDSDPSEWTQFCRERSNRSNRTTNPQQHVVIAGGGPTAVELGQSLARLSMTVTIVAPATLLPNQDVSLQQSACRILHHDGVQLRLGRRVVGVQQQHAANRIDCGRDDSSTNIGSNRSKNVILDDGTHIPNADALLVCVGRRPTVEGLDLDAANIAWDPDRGIFVDSTSLQSQTNSRVYACGDCCSAIRRNDRTAAHAAWTGYHAIRNMGLPWMVWAGSSAVHPTVPSVIYTDPALASVGLTRVECLERYGHNNKDDGFVVVSLPEEGTDRADMERNERFIRPCFVELRAESRTGRILGATACGPAAAELVNEVGLAIQNRLTVRDMARSIHSYPSHGYLLYRIALSMALSSVRGFLDTLGPVGRVGGKLYGGGLAVGFMLRPSNVLPWRRARRRAQREWESLGQQGVLQIASTHNDEDSEDSPGCLPTSFLEYYHSQDFIDNSDANNLPKAFTDWIDSKPI